MTKISSVGSLNTTDIFLLQQEEGTKHITHTTGNYLDSRDEFLRHREPPKQPTPTRQPTADANHRSEITCTYNELRNSPQRIVFCRVLVFFCIFPSFSGFPCFIATSVAGVVTEAGNHSSIDHDIPVDWSYNKSSSI